MHEAGKFGIIPRMKKTFLLKMAAVAAVGCAGLAQADELSARVAYGDNEIRLYTSPLAYEVLKDGKTMVSKTGIGLKLDEVCCKDAKPVSVSLKTLSGTVATPVYKKASVDLSGNEGYVDFGAFGVRLVARKDGVAYRFETKNPATITCENAPVTIPSKDAKCWYNRTNTLGGEETIPDTASAADVRLQEGDLAIYMPFAYSVDGKVVVVTDANVHNYPVWNLGAPETTEAGVKFESVFAKYPSKTVHVGGTWTERVDVPSGGRWVKVVETADYLTRTTGAAELPWRTFILADRPSQLCEADIVYALSTPQCCCSDFSWVKPGKVAWDWWNCFDNKGDPEGCTTATYERFIDFAAKTGVEYVIFDEGWSAALDIWKYSPVVDVEHLIKYADKKGVGIILWMAWAQIYGEEEKVAEHFAKPGAKGFKVDFMDRGDADVGNFMEKFAAACAKHKMLIDYHGVYRPTGLQRTYPNIVNYEGIHGLETLKWFEGDEKGMMFNDVAEFYLRLTAGPMDYTPGAMLNHAVGTGYKGDEKFPGSVGTRARQMAMMALYEAPLQMLCDSPTHYEKNEECFGFMAAVPTVWADTVGLCGCPDSVAACARKTTDGAWYAAAITTIEARDYKLCTKFLGEGEWKAEIFRDGPQADKVGTDYVHETKTVKAGDALDFHMAPGGGFIVRFSK